jgi:hypothetical protein
MRRPQSETCWIGVSHCAQLLEGVTFASCCRQALISKSRAYCRGQSGFALNIQACETASVRAVNLCTGEEAGEGAQGADWVGILEIE